MFYYISVFCCPYKQSLHLFGFPRIFGSLFNGNFLSFNITLSLVQISKHTGGGLRVLPDEKIERRFVSSRFSCNSTHQKLLACHGFLETNIAEISLHTSLCKGVGVYSTKQYYVITAILGVSAHLFSELSDTQRQYPEKKGGEFPFGAA